MGRERRRRPIRSSISAARHSIETLVAEARRRGFRDFLLLAGHRGEPVAAFLSERSIEARFDCSVQVSVEPVPASAGGALAHASPRLQDDFLLLDGERWFDFNWLDLFAKSRREGAAAAAALREVDRPGASRRRLNSKGAASAPSASATAGASPR